MLLNFIVRPPRATYTEPSSRSEIYEGTKFKRTPLEVKNANGETLSCTFFEPEERPREKMPCVIYMHGNASNKLEGEFAAGAILPFGVNLFAFDFSGCGNSEG